MHSVMDPGIHEQYNQSFVQSVSHMARDLPLFCTAYKIFKFARIRLIIAAYRILIII